MTSLPSIPAPVRAWYEKRRLGPVDLEALPGDVSPRRYFRFHDGDRSSILAYYPPSLRPALERFLQATSLLAAAGIATPEVLEVDEESGLIRLEDLGGSTLYDLRDASWSDLGIFLRQAVEIRRKILSLSRHDVARLNPPLDQLALSRELESSLDELLLTGHGQEGEFERDVFLGICDEVCRRLEGGEQAPCHRDFMARNLMVREGTLVVIDHQDLRLAPASYDLASLLNDSLFAPEDVEEQLLQAAGVDSEGRELYSLAVVQRSLKAAGTFARFARQGHPRHLPLVAPTLQRAIVHLDRLEIRGRFLGWIESLARADLAAGSVAEAETP